ncbi:hypothetical protein Y032_0030g2227 [Ancylostoma ceylanicum]|uniref:Uncharacterized protein n=1 Tax=Ancylostoma ceylanicum TaxID=53326 RepID=A0A016USA9_9BILA|nr:hypothetical protein Y032_0030g2227 [Ancylostoma ceylanicum]
MAEEEKTVTMKIYRDRTPKFEVSYENKKDLYKTFQKKLKELNLPISELYWGESRSGIRSKINNADDLLAAVQHCAAVSIYYRTDSDDDLAICSSQEEDEEESEEEDEAEVKEARNSRSPAPRRHRSRSSSFDFYSHTAYRHMPWNFAPWNFMMDPRFAPAPFHRHPHPLERRDRGKCERCHHCCRENMSKDLSEL